MTDWVIGNLLDAPIETVEGDPADLQGGLFADEEAAIASAVPKRVLEYTAGRVCAHRALKQLGLRTATAIEAGQDRAPIWPEGFVGSIAHTTGWCAASVARESMFRSVGIDVEVTEPLKESLVGRVCTEDEQRWLATLDEVERGLFAKAVFCAKEAVYKCQYPLTREYLGFHAVEVAVDADSKTFVASFLQRAGEFLVGDTLPGRFSLGSDFIAAACAMPTLKEAA